ncbi:lysozyme inhibitor LprI family protein [Sphingomonas sp. 22176]|uniref:lysozyme inhibitor LprI family protein n=1 Tax=Sphingomonas sp. 22176 TaxID=3453884 RepID=UPI003F8725E6
MFLFALAPLALAAAPVPAQTGPSFACSTAAALTEKAICADPKLSALDREMAQLFAIAKENAFGSGPSNQLAAQRTALQEMRACKPPFAACLLDRYALRNQELAIAALLKAPATALPILRRGDPAFAPILEAVQLWSEAPVDANWSAPERAKSRTRIAALLQPYLTGLQTKPDQSFGASILREPGTDGVTVKTIDDLFRSDRHFATFLNVLGPYVDEPRLSGAPRTLPCGAIVRHPRLLDATGPVFGSTMDNFVFRNDCGDTLPPLPSLGALQTKLFHSWPECEGTIRYMAYSSFNRDVDAARLGTLEPGKAKLLPARKDVTKADVANVERDLTAYYVTYLHRAPAAAATMARGALSRLMTDAHQCE